MRCSACGDVWFQTPPPEPEDIGAGAQAESPVPQLIAPSAPARPMRVIAEAPLGESRGRDAVWGVRPGTTFAVAPSRPSGSFRPALDRFTASRALRAGWRRAARWLILAAFFLLPLGGLLLFRTDVVNAWPKAARVYSALGIPVTDSGLLIHADYTAVLRDGKRLIEVRGEIENQSIQARQVPHLQLALYDADRRELYRWVVPVNRAPLDPKGKRAFRTTFPAPGKDVNVQIRFTEEE